MENILNIDATSKSPLVTLNAKNGIIKFSGRSITENALMFYQPLINWTEEYLKNPALKTTVDIDIEYINSSSVIWLMKLIKKLEKAFKEGSEIEVNWYYRDEDMCDAGEDLKDVMDLPFNLINLYNM